jgi:hypothetical protein
MLNRMSANRATRSLAVDAIDASTRMLTALRRAAR